MRSGTIAFLLGIVTLQGLAELPDGRWAGALLFLPFLLRVPVLRIPVCFALGLLWALLRAEIILSDVLLPELEGQPITVQGSVTGLPRSGAGVLRFDLDVSAVEAFGKQWPSPGRVRLAWYETRADLQPGAGWRLRVKLKRPHGFMNPGGFDYEGWLFQQRIRATGYVLASGENAPLGEPSGERIDRLRYRIGQDLSQRLGETGPAVIVQALAIGAQEGISPEQWRVLNRTGTSHLIAISGLHIGLVAGFGYGLGRWLWSVLGSAALYLAAPRFGALTGLLAAWAYSALAGFAVPTQRTLIMIAVVVAGSFARCTIRPLELLLSALLVVLVVDPFAVMSAGFWLSFAAVALIFYTMTGRIGPQGWWWKLGRVHLVIALGLTPLLLILFGQDPVLGPLANLVAVPWVSFVVVPLVLAGTLLVWCWDSLGLLLLRAATETLSWLWPYLAWLADRDYASWTRPPPEPWVALAACVGVVLLLLPRGIPARWIGVVWLLPLVVYPVRRPQQGELWFTLLDVGQGLAAVVHTRDHTLVYDTGPRFSARFDTGRAVLVPYLRSQGVGSVDTVVISHGDSDHSGGLASLLEEVPTARVITSDPRLAGRIGAEACYEGQVWEWNEIEFRILNPSLSRAAARENDRSCVLRIAVGKQVLLLPGDIERATEHRLVATHAAALRAQILVVPHHGSRSSSTAAFVAAVDPEYILFSTGYRNRFGFPSTEVLDRYLDGGAWAFNTAEDGALEFRIGAGISAPERYRRVGARYWHGR